MKRKGILSFHFYTENGMVTSKVRQLVYILVVLSFFNMSFCGTSASDQPPREETVSLKSEQLSTIGGETAKKKTQTKAQPWLAALALSLAGVGLYKKGNKLRSTASQGLESTKNFVQRKVMWPLYVKYAEVKEHGMTKGDSVKMGLMTLALWGLKKAQSTYDLISLGKQYVRGGAESLGSWLCAHPKAATILFTTLGALAVASRLYSSVVMERQARLLSPLDQFLLSVGRSARRDILRSSQLRSLIISENNTLSTVIESEEFIEFVSSLADEQQVYIYSLIDECQESTAIAS